MFKNLYLVALAALCGLSACQRQQVGGFQRTHTESFARTAPATPSQPVVAVEAVETVSVAPASQPIEQQSVAVEPVVSTASPELVASTDKLVAAAKGTRFEERALRMKAAIENASAKGQLNAAPRKLTFAEKTVAKMVAKKLNKKIAKAERGESTKALDKNLKLALIFAIAAIVLSLIPGVWYLGGIAGIVAVIFFVLWIIDRAG